jgi:uncharacterized protein
VEGARDQHLFGKGPKRILSLDGGGVRGLITLGLLERAETILKARAADPASFRLCHYFDLIGGTSTGGIIAALLALGYSVEEVREIYLGMCPLVFRGAGLLGWLGNPFGLVKSVFKSDVFAQCIGEVIEDCLKRANQPSQPVTLGSDLLQTGLAVVTKRIDSGSVWILSNNSRALYWESHSPDHVSKAGGRLANKDFALASLVRATASAPFYLDAVEIDIGHEQRGLFLDGGASPFNNPAKELFLMATLRNWSGTEKHSPFGFDWETGADKLLLLSLGTGTWRLSIKPSDYQRKYNFRRSVDALLSIINDGMKSSVVWLQALSEPAKPFRVDAELGSMENLRILPEPLLTFRHVNPLIDTEWIKDCTGLEYSDRTIDQMRAFENASRKNLERLVTLGKAAGVKMIAEDDFPKAFDIG